MAQNEQGDLIIEIRNYSGSEIYTLEAIRVIIKPENFLKIKETLQRMGIYSDRDSTLWQTAHILHKRGFYYILHFKELFALDGKCVNFSAEDEIRRSYIVSLLEKWNLLTIADPKVLLDVRKDIKEGSKPTNLSIIPHSSRAKVKLKSKYDIGSKKV